VSLVQRLSRPAALGQFILPSLQALQSTTRKVLQRWPNLIPRVPDRDREAIVQRVLRRVQADDWEGCHLSEVTRAAGVAFEADFRDRADLLPLRRFYLAEIRASTRPGFLRVMADIYIRTFVPGAPHTMALAGALDAVRERIGGPYEMVLRNLPGLFDPYGAPDHVAKLMRDMPVPFSGLKEIGIASPHAPGLMEFTHLAWLKLVAPTLRSVEGVERLLEWLKPAGQSARSTGAVEAIEVMLSPWLDTSCPDSLREQIVERLLEMYGDPRLGRRSPWATVSQKHYDLMLRWLTRADMQFFIGVVDATQNSHMWPPRRDFWMKLYNQGRIDAAWVAFSPAAADYARRNLMGTRGQASDRRFGRQTAGGGRSNTSLLIMKIGRKIVVDGCHSYRTHIFDESHRDAPPLFAAAYDCDLIMRQAYRSKSHASIHSWTGWVEMNT
jgi:EH_Signature domain